MKKFIILKKGKYMVGGTESLKDKYFNYQEFLNKILWNKKNKGIDKKTITIFEKKYKCILLSNLGGDISNLGLIFEDGRLQTKAYCDAGHMVIMNYDKDVYKYVSLNYKKKKNWKTFTLKKDRKLIGVSGWYDSFVDGTNNNPAKK
jgi:hypothetical protein